MLGVEALPAIFYFLALFAVPESPRWLLMNGKEEDARRVLKKVSGSAQAEVDIEAVKASIRSEQSTKPATLRELFRPAMRLVLVIGISVAILQQITGINSGVLLCADDLRAVWYWYGRFLHAGRAGGPREPGLYVFSPSCSSIVSAGVRCSAPDSRASRFACCSSPTVLLPQTTTLTMT